MISNPRHRQRSRLLLVVAIAALFVSTTAHAQRYPSPAATAPAASPLAAAPPESAGMSAARLTRLTAAFRKEIEDKKLPGAVMMIARKGKLVYATPLGVIDPKGADPMRTDTIFRIY
jgi:CubicO group peptidase (beta-lactamase class C family)